MALEQEPPKNKISEPIQMPLLDMSQIPVVLKQGGTGMIQNRRRESLRRALIHGR